LITVNLIQLLCVLITIKVIPAPVFNLPARANPALHWSARGLVMRPHSMTIRSAAVLLCICVVSCATHPTVRTDRDPRVDLTAYHTFAFFEPLTTDRKGYSTLLSARLRDATHREMQKRGFRYDPAQPDLLVNFNVNIKERQELRAMPRYGYFGYRDGLYDPWPDYSYDFYTVTYSEGTLVIDLVDAARKQLVWQGLATGRITDKVLHSPDQAVDKAVSEIFAQFPAAG
jgi:hypothetical protein